MRYEKPADRTRIPPRRRFGTHDRAWALDGLLRGAIISRYLALAGAQQAGSRHRGTIRDSFEMKTFHISAKVATTSCQLSASIRGSSNPGIACSLVPPIP